VNVRQSLDAGLLNFVETGKTEKRVSKQSDQIGRIFASWVILWCHGNPLNDDPLMDDPLNNYPSNFNPSNDNPSANNPSNIRLG
jgi:hypothetical protein